MKNVFLISGLALGLFATASCSSDDDYQSSVPRVSGLSLNVEDVAVGDTVIATLDMSNRGERIYGATYVWSADGGDDFYIGEKTTSATDPINEANPRCKFVAKAKGSYTLTLKASYKAGGQSFEQWFTKYNIPSGSVEYTTISELFSTITVTRKITVE